MAAGTCCQRQAPAAQSLALAGRGRQQDESPLPCAVARPCVACPVRGVCTRATASGDGLRLHHTVAAPQPQETRFSLTAKGGISLGWMFGFLLVGIWGLFEQQAQEKTI